MAAGGGSKSFRCAPLDVDPTLSDGKPNPLASFRSKDPVNAPILQRAHPVLHEHDHRHPDAITRWHPAPAAAGGVASPTHQGAGGPRASHRDTGGGKPEGLWLSPRENLDGTGFR